MYGFLVYSSVGGLITQTFCYAWWDIWQVDAPEALVFVVQLLVQIQVVHVLPWVDAFWSKLYSACYSAWHDNGVWLTNNRDGEISKW